MKNTLKMPTEEIKSRFYYDETSPSCLRYAKDVANGKGKGYIKYKKGEIAGSLDSNCNYYVVGISNKYYRAHRVILVLFDTEVDGKMVDHINGNSCDNTISNLRIADRTLNSRNCSFRKDNKTGVCGVTVINKNNKPNITAHCYENRKRKSKSFSINKYGYDEAFRLACEWRTEQIRLLNEQGAGYTERHGK